MKLNELLGKQKLGRIPVSRRSIQSYILTYFELQRGNLDGFGFSASGPYDYLRNPTKGRGERGETEGRERGERGEADGRKTGDR